ncbi:uncharacterized protein isoform X1 [Choristoneura fumiferana]|uniref:uncharacterized protein isoform X1 n=1 Tax=Choristoneura fumiferana TaxID=7141 RepID=UPI003D15BADC
MEPIFVNRTCLCGTMSLRTASFIVAYTYLLADVAMSTVLITVEAVLLEVKKSISKDQHYLLPEVGSTEGIMLGLWFLLLPFITSLLVGLHKNQAIYVKAYLFGIFGYMVLEITMIFFCFYYRTHVWIIAVRFIVLGNNRVLFSEYRTQLLLQNDTRKLISEKIKTDHYSCTPVLRA